MKKKIRPFKVVNGIVEFLTDEPVEVKHGWEAEYEVSQIDRLEFRIVSRAGRIYIYDIDKGCNCEGYHFRVKRGKHGDCKHGQMVRDYANDNDITLSTKIRLRHPLEEAEKVAQEIAKIIPCEVVIAGSIRRRKPTVGDIDLLSAVHPEAINAFRAAMSCVYASGSSTARGIYQDKYKVQIWCMAEESWGSGLFHTTGSREFNISMRAKAKRMGLKLTRYGLQLKDGTRFGGRTEQELFAHLEEPYVPPEGREMWGKFEFDPNSTKSEGRWRQVDPREFNPYSFVRMKEWPGVEVAEGLSYVVGWHRGLNKQVVQAVRFKKDKWNEAQGAAWWEQNRHNFMKTWVNWWLPDPHAPEPD